MTERLVEFRVWHRPTKRMYLVASFDADFVCLPGIEQSFFRKDCVLLQFTGVLDASGVKIFEGDILYWRYYDESEATLFESWHEVVFLNGAFGTLDGDEDLNTFYDLAVGDLVAGNMFENADLLVRCRPGRISSTMS